MQIFTSIFLNKITITKLKKRSINMEGNSKIHNSDAVYTVKNPGFVFVLILLEIVGIAAFVF